MILKEEDVVESIRSGNSGISEKRETVKATVATG